jgi:FrmR/RcnR family transcriptional regulator, repressor of frmRAB operon
MTRSIAGLPHTKKHKDELLARTRRIRGQIEAIERALEQDESCASVLQQIAACRGAINGLMGELLEGEVRDHVLSPSARPGSDRARAAEQLIQVMRTYLK